MTRHFLIVLVALAVTGCAPSLIIQHDTAADLLRSDRETYALLDPDIGDERLATSAVRPVLEGALVAKGYREVPQDSAEMIVTYKVLTSLAEDATIGNADEPKHRKTVLIVLQAADTWDILWVGWSLDEEVAESQLMERTEHAARGITAALPGRGETRE